MTFYLFCFATKPVTALETFRIMITIKKRGGEHRSIYNPRLNFPPRALLQIAYICNIRIIKLLSLILKLLSIELAERNLLGILSLFHGLGLLQPGISMAKAWDPGRGHRYFLETILNN